MAAPKDRHFPMFMASDERADTRLSVYDHAMHRLDESQPSAILDQQVFKVVASGGKVLARTPTSAVVDVGTPVNHVLHLLISVLLCGLWLPVWLIIAVTGGERRITVMVDEHGEIYDPNAAARRRTRIITSWVGGGTIAFLILLIMVIAHH
jgi:hypothetical protein